MLANKVALVQQMSTRVRNFTRKNDYLWNWSCDICGDSAKDTRKARFFVGRRDNELMCYCHNCGFTGSVETYFRQMHPDLSQTLSRDKFVEQAPSLYDPNDLMSLDDDILTYIFFINKFPNRREWLTFLATKKIILSKKSIIKLVGIHSEYHSST